ncbi:hypothetical protein ACJJTC_015674 [Scirpophaga incertulas]
MMCEWLACAEWCDVKLVCAGHTFNAHRAVLASVSVFLREILLSCPQEDTPIYIVLPDYDLEAMTSVLYYMYHGEVFVNNHKLYCFLDIIKTLEVVIDYDYLSKIRESAGDTYYDLPTHCWRRRSQNCQTFTLSSETDNHHEYVNIRKGDGCQDILPLQHSQNDMDVNDKRVSCRNQSDGPQSFSNSQAPYESRQRSSCLRDLYIETYPQNGNVNGQNEGVLAISNELYPASTSVLLTNANCMLPSRADDILSKAMIKMSDYAFLNRFDEMSDNAANKRLVCTGNFNLSINSATPYINYQIPKTKSDFFSADNRAVSSFDFELSSSLPARSSPNVTQNSLKYFKTINVINDNLSIFTREVRKNLHTSNVVKTQIFNQVIESPWRPRLPNNYKPFKRKADNCDGLQFHSKEEEVGVLNDKNNNVDDNIVQYNKYLNKAVEVTRNKFTCVNCGESFSTEDCLNEHKKSHFAAPRYSCLECSKTFSQLRNFKYHMSVHRGTREFAATCTVCGKYFNDRGYLSSHMKIHRNRKEYKCPQCPKSFNQRVAYNMHVRIHTGLKPHVCDECGKAFSRKMLLKQHQRTHSGERPYACSHCDKRFADRSNMTLHLRLHTGVKPFSCTLCPKSFTKKHHLKSHLNFHTGLKPYSCPHCHLGFTQSSNMKTHMKKCYAADNNTTNI